jgi:DNA-binding transcriptional LysR family regulator
MIPSLKGLQALSELSRAGSLNAAAKSLGVTRSALSHRIADLEQLLGVALVQKAGRGLVPTDDADALLIVMGDALDRIEAAIEPIRRRRLQLRVSTVATFASHWLLPRLAEFRKRYPDIEVALTTTRRVVDLEAEEFDCAIRHGRGDWPGLTATLLFAETLAPVAAPGVSHDIRGPSIIRARSRFRDWSLWWSAEGLPGKPNEAGLIVDSRAQALEAALAGAGIAMMDLAYVGEHVQNQKLQILGPSITLDAGYHLVHRRSPRNSRMVSAFRKWAMHASRPRALTSCSVEC